MEETKNVLIRQIDVAANQNNVIIMRDLNHPNINWEAKTCRSSKRNSFLTVIKGNYLSQLVQDPTSKGTVLDKILTNKPDMI